MLPDSSLEGWYAVMAYTRQLRDSSKRSPRIENVSSSLQRTTFIPVYKELRVIHGKSARKERRKRKATAISDEVALVNNEEDNIGSSSSENDTDDR
jgi:acyl carrier protein phosphodiesterase